MATKKPDDVPYAKAGAFPIGAMTAMRLLGGAVEANQQVLVYGASGSVGS